MIDHPANPTAEYDGLDKQDHLPAYLPEKGVL